MVELFENQIVTQNRKFSKGNDEILDAVEYQDVIKKRVKGLVQNRMRKYSYLFS